MPCGPSYEDVRFEESGTTVRDAAPPYLRERGRHGALPGDKWDESLRLQVQSCLADGEVVLQDGG